MTFPDAGLFLSRFIVRETCAYQDKIVGKSGYFTRFQIIALFSLPKNRLIRLNRKY